jgi:hypothetical protein
MPSLDDLLRSYQRSLVARVQLTEFAGWGPATTDSMRRHIADHVALEGEYIAEVLARRRQADADARTG